MKQIGKSIRDKLYNIAARQGINYQHLLIRYFHERFLYRLSESGYRKNFYLKGGTLLYAFNTAEQQRYTLDMDFSLHKMSYEMKIVEGAVKDICRIEINDGVRFDGKTLNTRLIKENNVYGGIRISIEARLDSIRQRLQIDIGYGDTVFPNPQVINFPVLLDELSEPSLFVYRVETVIAEKFHAMIELSGLNSRMKDFYDVYQLLSSGNYNPVVLKEAIATTFKNRKSGYIENHALFSGEFANDTNRNRMWLAFLKKIGREDEMPFPQVISEINSCLKPVWESLANRNT